MFYFFSIYKKIHVISIDVLSYTRVLFAIFKLKAIMSLMSTNFFCLGRWHGTVLQERPVKFKKEGKI